MRPTASSVNARNTMRANGPVSNREILFRRALWRFGGRGYRLHSKLPGRPDLLFPRLGLAVFIHGCFWHQCPECKLPQPKANSEFWSEKFATNQARDARTEEALGARGISTLIIWEHEIRPDPVPRAAELAQLVNHSRREIGQTLHDDRVAEVRIERSGVVSRRPLGR